MISPDVQSDVEILPATLKFTAGDESRVKTQQPQDKISGTPKILGSKPKKKQGR